MIQHKFSDLSDLFTEEYHPARSENKRFEFYLFMPVIATGL